MAKALGSTGATFLGMIKHVEAARPRVVIAENVDEFKDGSANAEFFWSAFQQIGYFNMKYNKQIHHSIVQCFTFQFSNFKFQKQYLINCVDVGMLATQQCSRARTTGHHSTEFGGISSWLTSSPSILMRKQLSSWQRPCWRQPHGANAPSFH